MKQRWRLLVILLPIFFLVACQSDTTNNEFSSRQDQLTEKEENAVVQQLIEAAWNGDKKKVQALLKDGVNINGTDGEGVTPVVAATQNRQIDIVALLIKKGADIDIRNKHKENVLLYASTEGLFDMVTLAVDAGADTGVTDYYGGTALIPAAERGYVDIVNELLVHSDVDVNHVNNLNWTALLEAIMLGDGSEKYQKIVQLLVDHGADMTIADGDGVTPLQHAKKQGYTEIVEILQKVGK